MSEENTELAISTPNTKIALFDEGTFQQMGLVANKLAQSSLIPQSLKGIAKKGQAFQAFPIEQVEANCFRIVEQAQRWGMSPFEVIDCASVVHGKLMWEGKLVAAVIESSLGIRLNYTYEGEGINRKVIVSGRFPDETEPRTIEGCVKDWKTDQWATNAFDQRLAYRGAREWARRHAPSAILGVVTDDEPSVSQEPRNVTPKPKIEIREDYKPNEKTPEVEVEAEGVKGRKVESSIQRTAKVVDVQSNQSGGANIILENDKCVKIITATKDEKLITDASFFNGARVTVELVKDGKEYELLSMTSAMEGELV